MCSLVVLFGLDKQHQQLDSLTERHLMHLDGQTTENIIGGLIGLALLFFIWKWIKRGERNAVKKLQSILALLETGRADAPILFDQALHLIQLFGILPSEGGYSNQASIYHQALASMQRWQIATEAEIAGYEARLTCDLPDAERDDVFRKLMDAVETRNEFNHDLDVFKQRSEKICSVFATTQF